MNTTMAESIPDRASWWDFATQHAYFYREAAAATFIFGIYLHVCRLVFGDELLLQYLLTPTVDKVFAIPMAYAAIAGLAGWKQLRFRSRAHRVLSMVIIGFIAISVPIHVSSYFGATIVPISAFPKWYSFVEGAALYPFFLSAVCRLRFAGER